MPFSMATSAAARRSSGLGTVPWRVERSLSWMHQNRRLRVCYDKRDDLHEAFMELAVATIAEVDSVPIFVRGS